MTLLKAQQRKSNRRHLSSSRTGIRLKNKPEQSARHKETQYLRTLSVNSAELFKKKKERGFRNWGSRGTPAGQAAAHEVCTWEAPGLQGGCRPGTREQDPSLSPTAAPPRPCPSRQLAGAPRGQKPPLPPGPRTPALHRVRERRSQSQGHGAGAPATACHQRHTRHQGSALTPGLSAAGARWDQAK